MTHASGRATADMTVAEVAAAVGVSRGAIHARIAKGSLPAILYRSSTGPYYLIPRDAVERLSIPARRRWTPEEDEWLLAHLGRRSLSAIARHLHRTRAAVQLRMQRHGHSEASEHFTTTVAAAELGLHPAAIRWLIASGELIPEEYRAGGKREAWLISQEEIERFIRNRIEQPKPKQRWRWRQMPPGYFRNYAERIARKCAAA